MSARSVVSRLTVAGIVAVSVVCSWLTASKLRVSSDLSALFPQSGSARGLARWTRAFGAQDPAIVLVRGEQSEDVAQVAESIAQGLRRSPSVENVVDRAPELTLPSDASTAWLHAGPAARRRLAQIVTEAGMAPRLADTRALLLAPGGDPTLEAWLARDPLRLSLVPWEGRAELAGAVRASPGGPFVADGGRARLVVAQPRGSPFVSSDATAFAADFERVAGGTARAGVTVELAGGHAIAYATEQMLRRDLVVSGSLSLVLASAAFIATFRRARALVAVLPPLVLGTLWTTGLAALLPQGLSAVAIAFAAVVVGVGVDTGVHVYAALLDARRAGRSGADAASFARAETWRPTLAAAAVAAVAFASLALSGLRAMRELGLLCAAGELLTALAILLVTPELGARLERGPVPAAPSPRWIEWLGWATETKRRSVAALAVCALPMAALVGIGWPGPADALVAIRPRALAPLAAEAHIREVFGSRPEQWIVLNAAPDEQGARERSDRVAEALEPLEQSGVVDGFDSLTTFAPSDRTQRERLAARDGLDLPTRREGLERALRSAGFDLASCAAALDAFSHPSEEVAADPDRASLAGSWVYARHLARDGGDVLAATYVRPRGEPAADDQVRAAIVRADPDAIVTSLHVIDGALREALSHDLLSVGAAALVAVALALRWALRSAKSALIALAVLACEVASVGVFMRAFDVRWHAFDALVLPVLFGVTVDESMFLLDAARGGSIMGALRRQGPLVASTGLTTAAGFIALCACHFDGLRDVGAVGGIGVLVGVVAALVVVPAALRTAT
jgi:predicted RND superfamily exporter protein